MSDNSVLTPVREAHRFDVSKLVDYLNLHVEGDFSDMQVLQFEGGQSNPTYQLTAGGKRYVLRKKPPGQLLKSAHQVDREYRVMKALQDTAVPVPRMYALCEDESVIGTSFYVMEHVEGRVFADVTLASMKIEDRKKLMQHAVEVMVALHDVDLEEVGLADYGRPGNYYERQISRWTKQYRASETEVITAMDELMLWLPNNIPESDGVCLAHGDFRIGNTVVHPTEPRVAAVLDWELSTTGDGLADLGYMCMMFYHIETDGYDWVAAGIPTEEDLVEMYCKCTGIEKIDNWKFYVIYNLFRLAAIVQGVYKRGLDGNASSESWRERSASGKHMAAKAWELVNSN